MNFRSKHNSVLLVACQETLPELSAFCSMALEKEDTKILTAATGLDGIFAFNRYLPCITIIEDMLPDMRGSSVCSILRDSVHGKDMANIFFVGDSASYLYSTYADFFFQKPLQFELLGNVLREYFYQRKISSPEFVGQIGNAKRKQQNDLPKRLETSACVVDSIFSAYSELSGDGLDYWFGENESELYGFVFDNTGHDLLAYSQASAIKTMLKISFKLYQNGMVPTLGQILYNLNNNLFTVFDDDPFPVAAVLFHLSFSENLLYYTPANMPCFYIDYGEGFTLVKMRNPVIGGFRNVDYDNFSLPLDGMQRLLFVSDGMAELLTLDTNEEPPSDFAKHDDVSGIIVDIKRD